MGLSFNDGSIAIHKQVIFSVVMLLMSVHEKHGILCCTCKQCTISANCDWLSCKIAQLLAPHPACPIELCCFCSGQQYSCEPYGRKSDGNVFQ